jgi:hypothetical protein
MSMYSPGQAQPIQPQSQGTPYGAQPDGNYAYATPNNRPAPFTQRYTNFDGTQSEQPNFGQRDAFIQNINDSMLPYYGGKSQGAPQFDFQSMYKQAGDMVQNGWQNPFSMPAQPQQPSLEQQLSQYAPQTQYQPASMPADPYARQPATSFYNPDEWQPERRRELQERARPLQQVNPATWTDQQWADYEAAQRTSGLADSGGYVRRDGKVFYNGGYGSRFGSEQEVTKDTVRDQYGLWRGAPPQPTSTPADPVRYDTGPYDPNGGRVIGGDRLPVVATQPATGGEWRPTARNPYAPLAYYPDGSDTPDPSYGTRPGRMTRPGAAPSEEVPGMGDRSQPDPLPSEDEWRVSVGGSWVSPESRSEFFQRGVKAGYTYGPPSREYLQAEMNRWMGRMKR